ncbi:MAG: acyl-CoA carboxylase subunit beta, partial [Castellaniella sp.]
MAILESTLTRSADAFQDNAQAMQVLLNRVRQIESDTRCVSEQARSRFEAREQLPPIDRVGLLLDRDSDFLELATLAGYGSKPADSK